MTANRAARIVRVNHFAAPFAFNKFFFFDGFIFEKMIFAAFRAKINIYR